MNLGLVAGCGARPHDEEVWSESLFALLGGALMSTESTMGLTYHHPTDFFSPLTPGLPTENWEAQFVQLSHWLVPIAHAGLPNQYVCPELDNQQEKMVCETMEGGGGRLKTDLKGCQFAPRDSSKGVGYFAVNLQFEFPTRADCDAVLAGTTTFDDFYERDNNDPNDESNIDSRTIRKRFGSTRFIRNATSTTGTQDMQSSDPEGEENNARIGADYSLQVFYSNFPSGFNDSSVMHGVNIVFSKNDGIKERRIEVRGAQVKEYSSEIPENFETIVGVTQEEFEQGHWVYDENAIQARSQETGFTITDFLNWDHTHDTKEIQLTSGTSLTDADVTTTDADASHVPIIVQGEGVNKELISLQARTQHNITGTEQVIRYPIPAFMLPSDPSGLQAQIESVAGVSVSFTAKPIKWTIDQCCWPTEGTYMTNLYRVGSDKPDFLSTFVEFQPECGKVKVVAFDQRHLQGNVMEQARNSTSGEFFLAHCY